MTRTIRAADYNITPEVLAEVDRRLAERERVIAVAVLREQIRAQKTFPVLPPLPR